ncbi:unnamed protein product [Euphydryas editha]|uniref:PHD-type domain-containing protein n=1 Tax=Euphydryas editha TaxID=104508 RepID=A0AAU9UYK3_EUPED|nr:unnamed protein product [Euphydryas editha]
MICAGCRQKTRRDEAVITCTSKPCIQTFHAACAKAERFTTEQVNSWICPDCVAKSRKGGDNSLTPVRSMTDCVALKKKSQPRTGTFASSAGSTPPNTAAAGSGATAASVPAAIISAAKITIPVNSTPAPSVGTKTTSPVSELQTLSLEINQLRQSASEMWDFLKSRLENISQKIVDFDVRLKSLESLHTENIELKTTVLDLKQQINNQAQMLLRNEVEITGVEELQNENPYHLVLTTAVNLGVALHDSDIVYASRVGAKRSDISNKQLQRPLVVAFTHRVKRDEFLKQAKVRRNLNSNNIVGQGPGRTVYVNERLTPANRRLFRSVRMFAKSYKYKHSWTLNGAIFVRKRDASLGSPAIRIYNEEDLLKLSQVISTDQAASIEQPSTPLPIDHNDDFSS